MCVLNNDDILEPYCNPKLLSSVFSSLAPYGVILESMHIPRTTSERCSGILLYLIIFQNTDLLILSNAYI
jgi:hypothetical protein